MELTHRETNFFSLFGDNASENILIVCTEMHGLLLCFVPYESWMTLLLLFFTSKPGKIFGLRIFIEIIVSFFGF